MEIKRACNHKILWLKYMKAKNKYDEEHNIFPKLYEKAHQIASKYYAHLVLKLQIYIVGNISI